MSITVILVIVTVAASFYAWSREDIYRKWMMTPYRVKNNNEFYRFITSGFIHTGYVHLGFNMLALYSFGQIVEFVLMYQGKLWIYPLFYLLGIIVSDIPTYLKHKSSSSYHSVGASGGVSAIIFSAILIEPIQLKIWFIPGFIFGAIYLIYSYYQAKNSPDNINHDSHFYGAVFGIIFTIILIPEIVPLFLQKLGNWTMPF